MVRSADVRLECPQCIIRDWRPTDREALVRHADNRAVWRNLTHKFPHPYTPADADRWFALVAAMPEPTAWAIEVEGEAVGGIGVHPGEGVYAHSAELGYWLAEPLWGRGIMTEAVRAVSGFAFEHFDLRRLEAVVFAWNPASMRVLERCGFVREGIAKAAILKDGELTDKITYALVDADPASPTPKGGPRSR